MSILTIYSTTAWIRELSAMAPMGILLTITKVGAAISPYVERTIAMAVFKGTDVPRTRPGPLLCGHSY